MRQLLCSMEITEVCNQACTYCYKYSAEYGVVDPKTKDRVATSNMLRSFAEWVTTSRTEPVCFQFHGGEPLSQLPLIQDFVGFCRSELPIDRSLISFAVQTNCTLATGDSVDWLVSNGVSIGVSFGGVESAQNQHRPMKGGQPSYNRAIAGIREVLRRSPNSTCILVVTEPNLLLASLVECVHLGFRSVAITPVQSEASSDREWQLRMASAHSQAVDFISDHNMRFKDTIVDQSTIGVLRAIHANDSGFMCQSWPCGAGSKLIALSAAGDLYPCDTLFGLSEWQYGNIADFLSTGTSLEAILASPTAEALRSRAPAKVPGCSSCHAQASCGGGCPAVTYRAKKTISARSPHCEYARTFHASVDNAISIEPLRAVALTRPELLL